MPQLISASFKGTGLLDGFPRTLDQVNRLDRVLQGMGAGLDSVFMLTASEREIVSRLTGRRVCPGCGEVYHVNNRPPRSTGVKYSVEKSPRTDRMMSQAMTA
mgnify:CR=1 FL=1